MKNIFLTLLTIVLLSLEKGHTQNLKLDDLITLNNLSLADFQEYMYDNQFSFRQANSGVNTKTDTISFVNKLNTITGIIISKKGNTVFVENIKEDYFQELNKELKRVDYFALVSTKVRENNILEKKYTNKTTGSIIEVLIISGTPSSGQFGNTYRISVLEPPKRSVFQKRS